MLFKFRNLATIILVALCVGCATHGKLFTDDDMIDYYWQRAQAELLKAGIPEEDVLAVKPVHVVWEKKPNTFDCMGYMANGCFSVMEYKGPDGKLIRGMRIQWHGWSTKSIAHEACHAILWVGDYSEWESLCHYLDDVKKVWR